MLAALLVAVTVGATPLEAEQAVAPETAQAQVGVVGAHFYIPGYRTGDFVTFLPSLRITRGGRWWGAVVAPIHYLTYVGVETGGLGDLVGAFGYGFYRGGDLKLDAGLWTQWPSGDSHQSLGSAHLMLEPQLDAAWVHGRWLARGSLAVRGAIAWGAHGAHSHQPLVAPHDLLDTRLDAAAGIRLFEVLELTARLEPVVVFIPHPVAPVGSRVSAGVGAAVCFRNFRLELSAAAPLTVNRAWDWQLSAALGLVL